MPIKPAMANAGPTLQRALALHRNQRVLEARDIYRQLLATRPDDARLLQLLGVAQCQLRNPADGILHLQRSLGLNPAQPVVLFNLGEAYKELGRNQQAHDCFDAAHALNPALDLIAGERLHMKMYLHDWAGYEAAVQELEALIAAGTLAAAPLISHAVLESPALQARCATSFATARFPPTPQSARLPPHPRGERIRIGYFSSDFCNHPVSQLIIGLLEAHDHSRFEIFGFSLHTISDKWRQRVRAACDHFIDAGRMAPAAVAELARSWKIDIAIDLNGYTRGNRTTIFSERVAPVQASYIGFLGTMGASYIDYLIADKTLVPDTHRQYYSEKIVQLPSYQCNARQVAIPDKPLTREDVGLPAGAFVFCCFNNGFKLTPVVFAVWMQILQQVEDSVLWLYVDNPQARQNLCSTAAQHGVDSQRLVFAARVPYEHHVARLQLADLFLDTFPYNAGATASDALRMGLPVVTRCGDTFASRMGASLLAAVGLPELVTTNIEDYSSLAVRMARDGQFRQALKQRLQQNLPSCDLFNTPKFTASMEAAYASMHEISQRGHPPGHIVVAARRGG